MSHKSAQINERKTGYLRHVNLSFLRPISFNAVEIPVGWPLAARKKPLHNLTHFTISAHYFKVVTSISFSPFPSHPIKSCNPSQKTSMDTYTSGAVRQI